MEKKLVAQVRYYERLFVIFDSDGDRVFTGTDEKKAREILAALNGYFERKRRKKTSLRQRGSAKNTSGRTSRKGKAARKTRRV